MHRRSDQTLTRSYQETFAISYTRKITLTTVHAERPTRLDLTEYVVVVVVVAYRCVHAIISRALMTDDVVAIVVMIKSSIKLFARERFATSEFGGAGRSIISKYLWKK
jgi:hypothetical protein